MSQVEKILLNLMKMFRLNPIKKLNRGTESKSEKKSTLPKSQSTNESESCYVSETWETNASYCDIPEPPLLKILYYLDVKDVVAAGSTCQRWNRIAKDDWLWRRLFQRDHSLPMNAKIGLRPGTKLGTYYLFLAGNH